MVVLTVCNAPGVNKVELQPELHAGSGLAIEAKVRQLITKAPMRKRAISAAPGQKKVSGHLNKVIRTLVATRLTEVIIADKLSSRLQQSRLPVRL